MSKIQDKIKALQTAADENAPAVRAAFLAVIEEIRSNLFDTAELEIAIANLDIEFALKATHIEDMNDLLFGVGMNKDAYIFSHTVNNIYSVGAATAIVNLPPNLQKAIKYDNLSERAINLMRKDGAKMVVDLTESSKAGVRAVISRSIAENVNPTKRLREIRQLIGLTDEQSNAVLNFRRQLETQQQLGFTPVGERRLSAVDQTVVNRHMREGHLTNQQIDDMVERYYQSMLNKRAWDIAHTESLNAINNGQLELWEQGLDQGLFDDNVDRKFWIVTRDDRLRPSHAAIPGMNPYGVKIRSQFLTPFGLVYGPGDRNSNLINCRCCLVLGEFGQVYTRDGYIK